MVPWKSTLNLIEGFSRVNIGIDCKTNNILWSVWINIVRSLDRIRGHPLGSWVWSWCTVMTKHFSLVKCERHSRSCTGVEGKNKTAAQTCHREYLKQFLFSNWSRGGWGGVIVITNILLQNIDYYYDFGVDKRSTVQEQKRGYTYCTYSTGKHSTVLHWILVFFVECMCTALY